MDTSAQLIISLEDIPVSLEKEVGGKAAKLSRLIEAGFPVPPGFCLTVAAYRLFVAAAGIDKEIKMELGRKDLAAMRWEELWDAALRIRSLFLKKTIPESIITALQEHYDSPAMPKLVAVRSSAPGEDSAGLSFAGLHESVTGTASFAEMIKAIRIVWASLWSDAALLYRKEMHLDPDRSAMAVVVQEFLTGGPSGVAFSRDPRHIDREQMIIEAVPGANNELVDGLVDPDRWIIARDSRRILERYRGDRDDTERTPLLSGEDLDRLYDKILAVETAFGWPVDVEWTGRGERLYILQTRPITSGGTRPDGDERGWYLTLRPKINRLKELAGRVTGELMPRLRREGDRLGATSVDELNDRDLAGVIKERLAALKKWRGIYYDDFIPLAHGVRHLGLYYNNEVHPDNPYEFMALLEGQELLASKRNHLLDELVQLVSDDHQLREILGRQVAEHDRKEPLDWAAARTSIMNLPAGKRFLEDFEKLRNEYTRVSFRGENLADHPEIYLHAILETTRAQLTGKRKPPPAEMPEDGYSDVEARLLEAVGPERQGEAREIIELGRLSWKLRDDDNILVGRLESLLLAALNEAGRRLIEQGKLQQYEKLNDTAALILAEALLYPPDEMIELPPETLEDITALAKAQGKPRQLVGQPAGPGLAEGTARLIRDSSDLGRFKYGEILVCDAIQPTMTHIVPLAGAIVERRGGMLIHGAIIAREMGIPCVNGVADAVKLIGNGETVTVDGYLGIVTVGEPEFRLEKNAAKTD